MPAKKSFTLVKAMYDPSMVLSATTPSGTRIEMCFMLQTYDIRLSQSTPARVVFTPFELGIKTIPLNYENVIWIRKIKRLTFKSKL